MELREKVARQVYRDDELWATLPRLVKEDKMLQADAILAIPEIAEALETARNLAGNQERQRKWVEGGGF